MLTGTNPESKMANVDSLVEKVEVVPDSAATFLGAQTTLIQQQKVLIDWLTGQVVNTSTSPKVPKTLKHFLKDRPTQFWLAGLILAIMSVSALVLFFALYDYGPTAATVPPPIFGHDDNLGDDIQVIHREEWLARPPLNVTTVSYPLKIARIMHTAGSYCHDYQACALQVLGLQSWQVATHGMPDIAYNYLIGGDGNVYVGRGAGVVNEWQKNAIDVVYLGNYVFDQLTDKMEEAGKRLLARLRKEGYLTPDYVVIGQNQTYNTQSPGPNIYKKIVKWPHFDKGLYFNN